MTWTAPRTWVTTELITSSQMNTHVRDNLLETAPAKVTTKGDSVWATGANAIVRLGVGVNFNFFVADSAEAAGVRWEPNLNWISGGANEDGLKIGSATGGGQTLQIDGVVTKQKLIEFFGGGVLQWKFTVDDAGSAAQNLQLSAHKPAVEVRMNINRTTGSFKLNDAIDAFNTSGITINQYLADDQILGFQSGDVAHGITDVAATSTFGAFTKKESDNGGLRIDGLNEGTIGMFLVGSATTEETAAPSNSSIANVMVVGQKKSGTSVGLQGANAHLFAIRNFGTTRWLVDAEGDTYRDGTDNTFDEWDDIQLARAFELEMSPAKVIRSQFDEFLRYGRDDLVRAGILTGAGDFYNESQLLRLVTGGLWQISNRINETTEALQGRLNQALARIEMLEQRLITND